MTLAGCNKNNYGHSNLPLFDIIKNKTVSTNKGNRVFATTTSGVMVKTQPAIHSSILVR